MSYSVQNRTGLKPCAENQPFRITFVNCEGKCHLNFNLVIKGLKVIKTALVNKIKYIFH